MVYWTLSYTKHFVTWTLQPWALFCLALFIFFKLMHLLTVFVAYIKTVL